MPKRPPARFNLAQRARITTGLTQQAFADKYRIAVGTLRSWEQGDREPDRAAAVYLMLIEMQPEIIAALVSKLPPLG
jgi:putative transcriptional regulator